jgi:hypothetical protein
MWFNYEETSVKVNLLDAVILSEAKNPDCVAWQLAATLNVGASSNATSSVAALPQNDR